MELILSFTDDLHVFYNYMLRYHGKIIEMGKANNLRYMAVEMGTMRWLTFETNNLTLLNARVIFDAFMVKFGTEYTYKGVDCSWEGIHLSTNRMNLCNLLEHLLIEQK